jgi:hypothetical protein
MSVLYGNLVGPAKLGHLWPLCIMFKDTVHKGFWAVSSETPPSANPVPMRESTEFSIREWEHSQKLAVKRYNFTCMPRKNTPHTLRTTVYTRLIASKQKTLTEVPSTNEETEDPTTEETPSTTTEQQRGRDTLRVIEHTPTPTRIRIMATCRLRAIAYLPPSQCLTQTGKYGHPTNQPGWVR